MHKVIIDGKEYIEKSEIENLIYKTPFGYCEEEFFKNVEKALGFKLFKWQKTFILHGWYRQAGFTTAEILRLLLDVDGEPLDYIKPPKNHQEDIFRKDLKRIWLKLRDANIPMRKVFWCERDKRIYNDMKQVSEAFKRLNIPTIPPLCINYKQSHGDEIDGLRYVCGTHHCPKNTPLTIKFECKGCDRCG